MLRAVSLTLLLAGAAGLMALALFANRPPSPELPDRMIVEVASWDDLPGWEHSGAHAAWYVFMDHCVRWFGSGEELEDPEYLSQPIGGELSLYGTIGDWAAPCGIGFVDFAEAYVRAEAPQGLDRADEPFRVYVRAQLEEGNFHVPRRIPFGSAQRLSETQEDYRTGVMMLSINLGAIAFEETMTPVRIRNNDDIVGRFTGYYEPELRGSREQTDIYSYPLLARPDDLVIVQLNQFPGDHDGRIAGRVQNGNLTPYESRTEIEEGALGDINVLAWVDPVDAFFLQIQGSGRVVFDDGSVLRAGYAGVNGHPYTAIGRTLINMGELTLDNVSMQSIRDWLHANPDRAAEVMRSNASYVFFRALEVEDPSLGPIGAAGMPLTERISLAIDPRYHAYGAPILVGTTIYDRFGWDLMIAQDTGGAIRGPIRGDIFFGYGDEAGALAGAMNAQGEMWVLVPNAVAERIRAGEADAETAGE